MLLCCLPWRRLAALIDEAEAKDGEVEELHKKRREVRGGGVQGLQPPRRSSCQCREGAPTTDQGG